MKKTGVQRLANVLKILVTIVFFCNLTSLFLVPLLVYASGCSVPPGGITAFEILALWPMVITTMPQWMSAQDIVLTSFLLFFSGCAAVILWQGRRVLDTILAGDTFTFGNAANMKRAAVCCFLISAGALIRTVWGALTSIGLLWLFAYNALSCPVFLMAGLLCLVMSALFRQAAELKAENDLTI